MKSNQKYSVDSNQPKWSEKISNEDLIKFYELSHNDKKIVEIKNSGKSVCYMFSEIINTSNDKNEVYISRAWDLNNSEVLQSASVGEFFVSDNQHMIIHRVVVVREGVVIDKQNDLNIRVIDDEKDSVYGLIKKTKKIHCVVNDLRLNDIFFQEYSLVTTFGKDNILDEKYFRYIKELPVAYWFYKDYSFKLIQNRNEKIRISKKYFRDDKNNKIDDESTVLNKGEVFEYRKSDYKNEYKENQYGPYLEISTNTSWKEISAYLCDLYKDHSSNISLKDSKIYNSLNLGDKEEGVEYKIQKIIEYVQNQIVYLYDAEIMHSYVPQSSQKTIESGSGDCKAKSLLLIELLNTIGIESDLILANYSLDYFIPQSLPSPFVFNHAIVSIKYKDQNYLVDSTWVNRYGMLEKRSQPKLSHFLSVYQKSDLISQKRFISKDLNIEEGVDIVLNSDSAIIKANTIYRRESADEMRDLFNRQDMSQIIESQNKMILGSLSYSEEKDTSNIFKDVTCQIISDDKINNVLIVYYESKIMDPYIMEGKHKVFKFYYTLNTSFLFSNKNKESPTLNFFSYPLKYTLKIQSSLFVNKNTEVTKRKLKIDNEYFHFLNKKSISLKKIEVVSEYTPKTFDEIKTFDLEKIKKDYQAINNSNFGVGVVYTNLPWFFAPTILLRILIAAIIVINIILNRLK